MAFGFLRVFILTFSLVFSVSVFAEEPQCLNLAKVQKNIANSEAVRFDLADFFSNPEEDDAAQQANEIENDYRSTLRKEDLFSQTNCQSVRITTDARVLPLKIIDYSANHLLLRSNTVELGFKITLIYKFSLISPNQLQVETWFKMESEITSTHKKFLQEIEFSGIFSFGSKDSVKPVEPSERLKKLREKSTSSK